MNIVDFFFSLGNMTIQQVGVICSIGIGVYSYFKFKEYHEASMYESNDFGMTAVIVLTILMLFLSMGIIQLLLLIWSKLGNA